MQEIQVHFRNKAYEELIHLQQDEETTLDLLLKKDIQSGKVEHFFLQEKSGEVKFSFQNNFRTDGESIFRVRGQ